MKNPYFAAASVLAFMAAAPAIAQSTSSVIQDGVALNADVEQVGSGNSSVIRQGDTSFFDPNVFPGTVTTASNSTATIFQDGASLTSFIVQGGDSQTAFVEQAGSGHRSVIGQGLLGAAGNGNVANVTQGGTAAFSVSTIYQGANGNAATLVQTGDGGNSSYIDQGYVGGTELGGDDNLAIVEQNGSSNNSFVVQHFGSTGSLNQANVLQVGIGNFSRIDQTASENTAMVIQQDALGATSMIAQGSTGNLATVTQSDGPGNSSTVSQGSVSGTNIGGDDSIAVVVQSGSGNQSAVFQTPIASGLDNRADILQAGTANNQTVFQGAIGNVTTLVQTGGSDNESYIDQGYVSGTEIGGDNNRADLEQDGSNNTNSILQNFNLAGSDNEADVLQVGVGNTSSVNQNGSFNIAGVSQYNGSVSQLTQTGDGNMATVTQGSAPMP